MTIYVSVVVIHHLGGALCCETASIESSKLQRASERQEVLNQASLKQAMWNLEEFVRLVAFDFQVDGAERFAVEAVRLEL